nr:glycosyltransferase family 2 protein [Oscillatoria laete-virens]
MSVYNNASTLRSCLRSVLLQTFQDWEFIIIDDGSTDESLKIIQNFQDPRIQVVTCQSRRGLPDRLNQIISLARGNYFARMDADDIMYPDRLRVQYDYLNTHPEVDLAGCQMIVFNSSGSPVGLFPTELSHKAITRRPLSGFHFPHPTWMGKMEWFRNNPYDSTFIKAQDQELLLRTCYRSHFACVNQVLMGYRQDSISMQKSWRGRYQFCRAIWLHRRRTNCVASAYYGIFCQCLKAAYDLVTLQCGLRRWIPSHRVSQLPPSQNEEWIKLWSLLSQ